MSLLKKSTGSGSYVVLFVIGLAALAIGQSAAAANHRISSNQEVVDCRALGVNPGDTLTLAGTSRGKLSVRNCFGASGKRILIQNDPNERGPLVIRAQGNDGHQGIECIDCEFVTFDGTKKWVGAPAGICGIDRSGRKEGRTQCGIQVVRDSGNPTSLFSVRGSSKNFTIRGVEIDGTNQPGGVGMGLSINDREYSKAENPGEWRENFLVENNYFHSVRHEGMYIGPNYDNNDSVDDLELRNIKVQYNLVENTGWTGIQIKTVIAGENSINHNNIYNAGWLAAKDNDIGHANGAQITEGTGSFYNNLVIGSGGVGFAYRIQLLPSSFGKQPCEIYNNVIVDSGRYLDADGIAIWRRDSSNAMPDCKVYNNTVALSNKAEIRIASTISGAVIRDNIFADNSGSLIDANSQDNVLRNNLTGTVDKMRFVGVRADDFRLAENSPAIDQGSLSEYPADDHLGIPRPQQNAPDQGAFEFVVGGGGNRPNPPTLVSTD